MDAELQADSCPPGRPCEPARDAARVSHPAYGRQRAWLPAADGADFWRVDSHEHAAACVVTRRRRED
eukprot:6255305-Alexandrium_andersonii.AAC.1